MQVKLFSLITALFISGCYSQAPKQAVIVVEKSSNLENINYQRLGKPTNIKPKAKRVTNQLMEKTRSKPKKINKKTVHWQIPVDAKVNRTFSKKHPGLSFSTHNGQAIRSIRDGKIIYIGNKMKSYGQMIIVRHPLGFNSTYTQTQALQVALGDQVKKGDVIASTNNQPFYFEMKKFDQAINPLKYLK